MKFASSGNTYEGNWKDNVILGKGLMTYSNGDTLDGLWRNGKIV